MNKKIFTLLAGAFLMFAMVFSVKAQVGHGLWDNSRLNLGDSVRILNAGMNPDYYHLQVAAVVEYDGSTNTTTLTEARGDKMVLYMGQQDAQGNLMLFIDVLDEARTNFPTQFSNGVTTSKAEESAASLWCVNIDDYDQGKNITFDFVNKQQQEMLGVDIYDYELWTANGGVFTNPDKATHTGINSIPGAISGWKFSGAYKTTVEVAPMLSYITPDTVAVLCMLPDDLTANGGTGSANVYIKIADASDVENGNVDGVIYFRLMNSAPFIINAVDYNTMFGSKPSGTSGRLKFNKDVTDNYTNPFSKGDLTAEYLPLYEIATRVVISDEWHPWNNALGLPSDTLPLGQNYDTLQYTSGLLDSLGYMRFRNTSGDYVQVLRNYFEGNVGGHQFLQIGTGDWASLATNDAYFYGQYAFRMVYYPTGDSIYINPYQATYLPSWDTDVQKQYGAYNWTDSATLSVFTYYADTAALDTAGTHLSIVGTPWPVGDYSADWALDEQVAAVTARLKYGKRTNRFFEPFEYYQKLYVSLQDLTGTNRRLTLYTNATQASHKINTHINFGIYNPCDTVEGIDRTTVAPDVYLIRNTAGQYLQVPLYSATDSAVWVTLEKDEDPRYVPSFHWVVEQRYTSSTTSPVKITNREFEWLIFDNVQLYNDIRPIELRNVQYTWNLRNIHTAVTDWDNHDKDAYKDYAFIKVGKEFKNNPLLGYTWIDPDTAVVNLYAFNYMSGIDDTKYIGWNGKLSNYPNTDTLLYVNYDSYFDKMYFSLDTIREDGYGDLNPYGFPATSTTQIADLVTLKRQAYRLTYKDPYKYNCIHEFCMAPGEEAYYGITKKGIYKDFLGKPVFYLRDYYKAEDDVPYFALVQRIDSTTTSPSNTADTTALRNYLTQVFGGQATEIVMGQLRIAGKVNPGLFVAAFEDATAKLKMTLRADAQLGGVATFKLEKDVDPLYRRFNTEEEGENNDDPDLVHFYDINNTDMLLFENTGYITNQQKYWNNGKKNYLGIVLRTENPNLESHSSTTIYVDTAYVNRGTGYIKPQYLLAVRPQIVEAGMGCDATGEPTIPLPGYVEAYYLINAYDSAYTAAGTNNDYLWETGWTRLVFTRAIHANDYLYILGNTDLSNADVYGKLQSGAQQFDLDKLHAYALRTDNDIHAIYLGNNLHKDCVFSFRLVERRANDFIIESETTARDTINGPMIAPCEGGWIKYQNGVPVITRSDEVDGMGQALIFNVYKAAEGEKPTSNDEITTSNVTVIGNSGNVTILNAAGKSVVINNILGQTVAKTVLTSDNETIPVSKGVVIVSIAGEDTVKTLVK